MKRNKHFKIGDKVFAKIKGYPPWPAIVISYGSKKYSVQFYGTNEMGFVKPEYISYYLKHKTRYAKASKKKEFFDAIREIEQAIAQAGGTDGGGDDEPLNSLSGKHSDDEPKKGVKRKRSKSIASDKSLDGSLPPSDLEHILYENTTTPTSELGNEESSCNIQVEDLTCPEEYEESEENQAEPMKPPYSMVFEETLLSLLVYGEHVEKNPDLYKSKAVEPRNYKINEVLPIKLANDKYVALKLHSTWPLKFNNEYEGAKYDTELANRLLEQKELVKNGRITMENRPELFALDFDSNEAEINGEFELRKISRKYKIIERLRMEASLIDLDAKIKNSLTLDKADAETALVLLDDLLHCKVDVLMLKKHPHVVEMVRRLRKYVGNLEEWNYDENETEKFNENASKIRDKAEKIFEKLREVLKVKEDGSAFFDEFDKIVEDFKQKCHSLTNEDVFALCADPDTREAILDIQDHKIYLEQQKEARLKDVE